MTNIRIETFEPLNEHHYEELEKMLVAFSEEIYGYGQVNIDQFLEAHWAIYLAVKGEEVVGFTSFMYNHYFGLKPPTVGNTYLYVKPEYRKSKASYLLTKQAGYVSIFSELPLETYYASDASRNIGERILNATGSHMFDAHVYTLEQVREGYKYYTE